MTTQMEQEALQYFQQRDFDNAIISYTQCLDDLAPDADPVAILLNRSSCYQKLQRYKEAIADCDYILHTEPLNEKALWKKTKILCYEGSYEAGLRLVNNWLREDPSNSLALKEKKRLTTILGALTEEPDDILYPASMVNVSGSGNGKVSMATPPVSSPSATSIQSQLNQTQTIDTVTPHTIGNWFCGPCDLQFHRFEELDNHLQSDAHKSRCFGGKEWQYRHPPRGIISEEYTICDSFSQSGKCVYGETCMMAHSEAELAEWKIRFEAKRTALKKEPNDEYSIIEKMHEKLANQQDSGSLITDHLDNAKVLCSGEETVTMITKHASHSWTYTVISKKHIHRVILLHDSARPCFHISSVSVGPKREQKHEAVHEHSQVWTNVADANTKTHENIYRFKIAFRTTVFGVFKQTVLFDFGSVPVLGHNLQVNSAAITDDSELTKMVSCCSWDESKLNIIAFETSTVDTDDDKEQYPCPRPEEFVLSSAIMEPLTFANYRKRMHDLLHVEELEQIACVAKYSIDAKLLLVDKFMCIPSSRSSAKYATGGQLFAQLKIENDLSDDTAHGRLLLQSCNFALLAPGEIINDSSSSVAQKVYQIRVEDNGKNFIFFRLSAKCVDDLNLQADQYIKAQLQFQLNHGPFCDMHLAIDKLQVLRTVFPDISEYKDITWQPISDESFLDKKLNKVQREAVAAISSDISPVPPVIVVGPYGTGKTFTFAQAVLYLSRKTGSRVLICTHSNSAADLYINDYFDPAIQAKELTARPLRIMYTERWIQTVAPSVLQYCLIHRESGKFRLPTRQELDERNIVVVTLATCKELFDLDLPNGYFSHIFIDEAAQALEAEMLIPLCLASDATRVILAGDHMQLSPEVHSVFARQRDFHVSFLERLYNLYPLESPCRIMLCENYRSHQSIVDFTSQLFYSDKILARGLQLPHPTMHPLTFSSARGEDVQHTNNTGFYNLAEVFEVADRVTELLKSWPAEWGSKTESSIAVVAPYYDQVMHIRAELRKRKITGVVVERVFNIQGKQFRVVILSTVRTKHTCSCDNVDSDALNYGFLSNVKLMITAVTRAQSLVLAVGDPFSLCSIGKCRKIWEEYINRCNNGKSLYGATIEQLRSQFDGLEIKRTYVLNPNAPEFVPNRFRHTTSLETPETQEAFGEAQVSEDIYQNQVIDNAPPAAVVPVMIVPPAAAFPYVRNSRHSSGRQSQHRHTRRNNNFLPNRLHQAYPQIPIPLQLPNNTIQYVLPPMPFSNIQPYMLQGPSVYVGMPQGPVPYNYTQPPLHSTDPSVYRPHENPANSYKNAENFSDEGNPSAETSLKQPYKPSVVERGFEPRPWSPALTPHTRVGTQHNGGIQRLGRPPYQYAPFSQAPPADRPANLERNAGLASQNNNSTDAVRTAPEASMRINIPDKLSFGADVLESLPTPIHMKDFMQELDRSTHPEPDQRTSDPWYAFSGLSTQNDASYGNPNHLSTGDNTYPIPSPTTPAAYSSITPTQGNVGPDALDILRNINFSTSS